MRVSPAIKGLQIRNLFSFGDEGQPIELGPLNILIGPNASGKSNFIAVLGLLKELPRDFADGITRAGGISECLFKGHPGTTAAVTVIANLRKLKRTVRYEVGFGKKGKTTLEIVNESLEAEGEPPRKGFFATKNGVRVLLARDGRESLLEEEDEDSGQSVLSRLQDSKNYPEITSLGRLFRSFRLYPDWEFGQSSHVRDSFQSEAKNDYLEEDISNLGLMLNRFRSDPKVNRELLKHLKAFYEDAEDIHTPILSGLVDIRVQERGEIDIPAIRLSDGTLRWLALLVILLHPTPPPLICLEEPELGLHPDAIRTLGELLAEASQRTQLIVTTHSDSLVDQFTLSPEAVVVCEKHAGSTVLKRLNGKQLTSWLKRYTLGQLWRTGEIGGNRW